MASKANIFLIIFPKFNILIAMATNEILLLDNLFIHL